MNLMEELYVLKNIVLTKAFDEIERNFLFKVVEKLAFYSKWVKWVFSFYWLVFFCNQN